jgi:hypothetical protein
VYAVSVSNTAIKYNPDLGNFMSIDEPLNLLVEIN